ncbi:MAG: hypothetical protein Q8R47_00975 [Nanoarchaeota archaeon]|nr:hypothetical protein [Nanoarchaeota archaeon]
MPRELDLDYICHLEDRWKNHLSKDYDPGNPEKRMVWDCMTETIDDMKNDYETGIMLYDLFKAMETGSLESYKWKYSKNKK